jgi:hypothetical protein
MESDSEVDKENDIVELVFVLLSEAYVKEAVLNV